MRKVVVTEFLSLDGVMEDPGGAETSKHGGWSIQYLSDDAGKFKLEELLAADALLLGRVTYQGFADRWPSRSGQDEFAERMNSLRKFVVSRTLQKAEWNNSTLIRENVADEVTRLKQLQGKDILVAGSGQLAHALMKHSLVDEYRLMVHPIVVGSGKRLFRETGDMLKLKLMETRTFGAGVVLLRYRMDH